MLRQIALVSCVASFLLACGSASSGPNDSSDDGAEEVDHDGDEEQAASGEPQSGDAGANLENIEVPEPTISYSIQAD